MPKYKAMIDVAFEAPEGQDPYEFVEQVLGRDGVVVEGCVVERVH